MESKLPKNWVKTSPLEISKIIRGVSYGKTDAFQYEFDNSCLILRGGNIQDGEIVDGKDNVYVSIDLIKNEQLIQEHDVIIVGSTGSKNLIGKAATSLFDSDKISFGAFLMNIRAFESINKRYFSYYFQTNYYREVIRNLAGGVNINNIRKEYIENLYFPLPPLGEQNRIVDKLDRLFAQLENIKTSMANIPILLKNFRQQVLTQAVSGKLTAEWRKSKKLKVWKNVELNKVLPKGGIFDGPFGSNLKTEDYTDKGIRVIRLENIEHLDFIENKETYVSDEKYQKLIRHSVGEGDIIFSSFISENIRACLLPILKTKAIAKADCFCIRPDETIINKNFLLYILVSNITYAQLTSYIHGATRPRINTTQLKTITIPLVPLKEQEEIVKRVKSLFAKADAIEHQYQSLKQKIDNLPQAILHKAFKGELTEQLQSDGDARELLKEIHELKNIALKPKKVTTKKVRNYPEEDEVLGMVAETKEKLESKVIKLKPTNSEIYKRTLLAAEIVYQLKDTNTLGHLKLQKMLYLCQEIGSMNLPMNFLKQAMGPYDNQLARSIDKQFVIKKWFEYQNGALLKYKPLENCGSHKEDFQKYFETEVEQINYLINKFKKFTSNQIEAVATLYACWKEAIEQKELITDKLIITKFYQWSKEKEKFREENMIKALDWMRRNGVEPK